MKSNKVGINKTIEKKHTGISSLLDTARILTEQRRAAEQGPSKIARAGTYLLGNENYTALSNRCVEIGRFVKETLKVSFVLAVNLAAIPVVIVLFLLLAGVEPKTIIDFMVQRLLG